jgi:hypothetical protein
MRGKGTFRLLVGHFWGRFFASGRSRSDDAARERFAGTLAALTVVCPIVFFALLTLCYFIVFDVAKLWPLATHYFGLCIIASGFLAVAAWEDLFPDETDQAVLSSLPLPTSSLMWAKAAALAVLMGIGTLALSALTPLVFAIVCLPDDGTASQFFRLLAGHFAGACLACLTTFFACGALRGLALLLPDWRSVRRLSSWLQSALAFALVAGFALLPWMARDLSEKFLANSPTLLLMPPLWFVGLAQWVVGQRGGAFDRLALAALSAPAVAAVCLVCLLSVGFRRFGRLTQDRGEGFGTGRPSGFPSTLLNRVVLRSPQSRAAFWFFVCTLWRGPRQRLRLLTYLAAAAGWIVVVQAAGSGGLMYAAPVAGFLAVAGVRSAASISIGERAAWIIRVTERRDKADYLWGLRWAVWLGVLLPTFCFLAPVLSAYASSGPLLACHLLLDLLAAALLSEALVLSVPTFPFTALPAPGSLSGPILFVLGFYAYVKGIGLLESLVLTDVWSTLLACAAALLALSSVVWSRRAAHHDFVFQEALDLTEYGLSGREED